MNDEFRITITPEAEGQLRAVSDQRAARQIERETLELGIHDASRSMAKIVETLNATPGVVSVLRYGKPVLAIITWDDYEGLMETLEIAQDPDTMEVFRRAVSQIEAGEAVPFDEVAADLGI